MLNLQTLLRTNALSCLLFGSLFTARPQQVAAFLAEHAAAPTLIVLITGLILIAHGLHLLWAAQGLSPSAALIFYFAAADWLWVLASLSLIVSGLWINTLVGIVATLLVATMVGIFGLLQWLKK